MFTFLATPNYNSNAANIPGDLDINMVGMSLNPIPPQNQSVNSCSTGSSHRKDNNR